MLFFKDYREFAEEYNFLHRTSLPGYAQSNGKAELEVGIVKVY